MWSRVTAALRPAAGNGAMRRFGTFDGVFLPTLLTIATLDFAFVMLAESALSFLGIGIQAPEVTWGLMVSQGRQYLTNAWWLAFWPGLAIILTTMSLNLLSSWMRVALNPTQRWRLEIGGKKNG